MEHYYSEGLQPPEEQDGVTAAGVPAPDPEDQVEPATKTCSNCKCSKPVTHFRKRSGRRPDSSSRRGICRACRKKLRSAAKAADAANPANTINSANTANTANAAEAPQTAPEIWSPRPLVRRPLPKAPPKPAGPDPSILRPTREGFIRMRGITDKGRRWYQETDLETAVTLVKEYAAVVINPHTIRRLYSNKKFRSYILARDRYTCHFCGEYGDTIDHLLPRAKGGHTTPLNCVCACNLCNQSKADRSLEDFMLEAGEWELQEE